MSELRTIGRSAYADFPELGLNCVDTKIDTGAYTSSMHCSLIEKTAKNTVRFTPLDEGHHSYKGKTHELPIEKETNVKSSNGFTEMRYVVKTKIELMEQVYTIFLTLTNRGDMKYPVLIGRRFLAKKFIVDVTKHK